MMNASDRLTGDTNRLAEDTKDVVQNEIAALRAKVEALMSERVTPALSELAGQAEDVANGAAAMAKRQTDHLSSTVRAQPLVAIGTAAIAGLAIGLLMRR